MKIQKDTIVEMLKEKINEWDANLERFKLKGYPVRLLAQIQYRKKMKALLSMRLLVEKMMARSKSSKPSSKTSET